MKKLVLMLFALFTFGQICAVGDTPDEIVAAVNGTPIYREQLNAELTRLEEQAMIQGEMQNVPLDYNKIEELRETTLQMLIERTMLLQEGTNRKIKADSVEIEEYLYLLKIQFPTEKQYYDYLQHIQITEKELKSEIKNEIIIQSLIEDELQKQNKRITEKDCRDYYNRNIEEFRIPSLYRIREIRCVSPPPDFMQNLHDRISAGEDFASVAKKYSGSPSRDAGGDLGYLPLAEFPDEMQNAILVIQRGEISDVFRMGNFEVIIKISDIQSSRTATFSEAYAGILNLLQESINKEVLTNLLSRLHEGSDIVIYPE